MKDETKVNAELEDLKKRVAKLEELVALSSEIETKSIQIRMERRLAENAAKAAANAPEPRPPQPRVRVHVPASYGRPVTSPQELIDGSYVTRFELGYSSMRHYDELAGDTTEWPIYPTRDEWLAMLEIPTVAEHVAAGHLVVRDLTPEECAKFEKLNPSNPSRDVARAVASMPKGA